MTLPNATTPKERSTKWLAAKGLRPTRQRLALAELLMGDGKHRHVTAESLFDASKASAKQFRSPRSTIPCARFVTQA